MNDDQLRLKENQGNRVRHRRRAVGADGDDGRERRAASDGEHSRWICDSTGTENGVAHRDFVGCEDGICQKTIRISGRGGHLSELLGEGGKTRGIQGEIWPQRRGNRVYGRRYSRLGGDE